MIQYVAKREQEFNFAWVARDHKGNFIDKDRYRSDLRERLAMQEIDIVFEGND